MGVKEVRLAAKLRPAFFLVVLLCSLSSQIFAVESEDDKIPEALLRMENADPNKDFEEAIKHRDFRFVGIHGYALIIPGVESYHERYEKTNGVKVIEGTSDVLNKERARLQKKAEVYAEKYNKLLLKYLETK